MYILSLQVVQINLTYLESVVINSYCGYVNTCIFYFTFLITVKLSSFYFCVLLQLVLTIRINYKH